MARTGRKRKLVQREPNGRPQRPTQAVLNEINEREAKRVKTVVLMQPHRKHAKDPEARELEQSAALERFLKAMKSGDETLLSAGLAYKSLVNRWRATKGIACDPSPEEKTGSGSGEGPPWQTVQGWLDHISDLEAAMLRASGAVLRATKRLVVDNIDPTTRQERWDALLGLRIVASEFGMLGKDHPFR